MNTLTIDLNTTGMGLLHRAGLAGLWLTLDALEDELATASPRALTRRLREMGSWERTKRSVTLHWASEAKGFFKALLEYAYPIDVKTGLLSFGALGDPLAHAEQAFATHQAMLLSFLQHNKWRTSEKGRPSGSIDVHIEDTVALFTILRVIDHKFRSDCFLPGKAEKVGSMLVPGGGVRHTGLTGTSLVESPDRVLALRFAPVGCVFYLLRHYRPGERSRFEVSVVVPEVDDLNEYAGLRRAAAQATDLCSFYSAGPAEAALDLLTLDVGRMQARRLTTKESRRCRVMTFGKIAWNKQQRTRVAVLDVDRMAREDVTRFRSIRRHLPARRVASASAGRSAATDSGGSDDTSASAWIDVPQVPELAAENLIRGRQWWWGFADFVADKARRDHVFRWERKGLSDMARDITVMPEDAATSFVRACHEAWRNRLGQLGERARDQKLDFSHLAEQEFERTRIAFSRCKTQTDFRRTVTDFWARGGSQARLREHWPAVLPYLNDPRKWQEGRDLALLALVSYARDGADASAGLANTAPSGGA